MATITSLGIGSGLDLNTLLTNLTTAEKQRLTPITASQSSYSAKLTAYGTLKSALQTFSDASTALGNADVYKSSTATSSNANTFSVTTGAGAAAGRYSIGVSQLAQAQSLVSGQQTDINAKIGTSGSDHTITIQQGGTAKPLVIKLTDDQTSMAGVRDAINNANGGVTASILKVGDSKFQLVINANNTGTNNAMSISVGGDSALNSFIGYTDGATGNGMTQTVNAQNAKLSVNNIAIESDSNTIVDAPQGITLNLTGTTVAGSDATLTVSKDITKAATAMKTFVDAYNALQTTIGTLTAYSPVDSNSDAQSTSNGALIGDSTLRDIQAQLKNALGGARVSGAYTSLASVGVTSDPKTGQLTLDSDKLNKALTADSNSISKLMVGDKTTPGIAVAINNLNAGYLSTSGSIETAKTGVNNTLKQLTKQYNTVNDSINDTIARYKTSFTALDVAMSKLKNTGDYLTQQFEAMNSSSS